MQKYKYQLVLLLLFFIGTSCGSVSPSENEIAFALLEGNWSLGSNGVIELDGSDVSLNFSDFSLSFADGTYETTNGGNLFNANGTWDWSGEDGRTIILDTGEEVTINILNESTFRFSFFHEGNIRSGIRGNYIIQVGK
ncbi:hypothetical protein [Roseivirga sp.]|uniref:hypothetical protein n=1 Tax=Roseivirga sp. TaxID=1964215 RepID=UPI003B8E94FE